MRRPNVVAICGNVKQPSRTRALTEAALSIALAGVDGSGTLIDVSEHAGSLLSVLRRDQVGPIGERLLQCIEAADLLIVSSPVYRASYSGAMKHVFDLVRFDALGGAAAVLIATGGTPMHGLMLEHQMRPLLGFFGVATAPTTVYALETDFVDHRLTNPDVEQRLRRAIAQACCLTPLLARAALPETRAA